MANKYPFNPQILPGKPLTHHEHLKVTVILLIMLIVALVVGLWYMKNLPF